MGVQRSSEHKPDPPCTTLRDLLVVMKLVILISIRLNFFFNAGLLSLVDRDLLKDAIHYSNRHVESQHALLNEP